MNDLLQTMTDAMAQNIVLGILLAFAAGMLTVFTPCSLTNIPLIISYIGGTGTTKKKTIVYSIFICIGQSIVFVSLGLIAASLGKLMGVAGFGRIWHVLLALLMIWMAFEMFGITNILHRSGNKVATVTQKGIWGALAVGMLGAIFSTPCSTPILAAMLTYVSATGASIFYGAILLLSYAIGHSLLLVIAGSSLGFVNALSNSEKFFKISKIIKFVMGILMIALAAYLIIDAFYS